MADPKYAGLPGIVTDQPDVYESSELPESEQHVFHDALDTGLEDAVEVLHISAEDAHSKFAGKYVDSDRVDFSDRISGKLRTGYPARRTEWAVSGVGGPETLLQRYNRLMCEVAELQGDLAQQEGGVAVDPESDGSVVSAAALQQQVQQLQQQLSSERPPAPPSAPDLSSLIQALRTAKSPGGAAPPKDGTAAQGLTYQLYCTPEAAGVGRAAQSAALEQRLKRLEDVLGKQTDDQTNRLWSWTRAGSVLGAVDSLGSRLALLEPRQLELLEGRLGGLLARLGEVRARGGLEQGAKVAELAEVMQRCEALCGALPALVDRLTALQDMHVQAGSFQQDLRRLQAAQTEASAGLSANEALLASVAERFASNLAAVEANLASLQARLDKLQQ